MKAPSTKFQAPEKLQIPSTKINRALDRCFEAWLLVLLWSLKLGVWSFFA
jgi:hypothetical protein